MSGDLLVGTTWDNAQAPVGAEPTPNFFHNIVSGHNVTADGSQPYNGVGVNVVDGTLTYTASAVDLPSVVVSEGATVTETTTGQFFLGDLNSPNGLGSMELNGTLTINAEGGSDAALDMAMSGNGTANVTVEAGGTLFLSDMSGFGGTLQFNGSGDEVSYFGPAGGGMTVEMNSTGDNRFAMNLDTNGDMNEILFNEQGEIDHSSEDVRLMNPGRITANANVAVDLTKTFVGNERRLFTPQGWGGSGDITVDGTVTDPTDGVNVSLNKFENENRAPDNGNDSHLATDNYSGVVTANDFVNVEVRRHIPTGEIVVNQNALLEVGIDEPVNLFSTRVGEITVNSGGTLEVGYEDLADSVVGHVPYNLRLTTQRGGSGDLTLNTGSATVMQISGTGANQFDTISAEGTVSLGGVLEVLIDPSLTAGTTHATQGTYVPTDGDTFEIISVAAELLSGDYDASGTVDAGDYALWKETFGSETDMTADGNQDGIVDLADYTVWRDSLGASGSVTGSLTGDFSSMVITDPGNVLAGFSVSKTVTTGIGGNVTLTINSVPGALSTAAVPEPSSLLLAGLATLAAGGLAGRRRRMKQA